MSKKKPLPLEGLKVIELATVVAVPTVGRLLANYGAEVIKIETPPYGDQQRRIANLYQMTTADRDNPGFDIFNTGKKKISLNLKTSAGVEVMDKLLKDADIFLSNVRMESLKKMSLDYDSMSAKHPKIVYAHLSGYGLNGPDAQRPGFDYSTFWLRTGSLIDFVPGGVTHLSPTYGFGDMVTAANLLSGILMAVIGREKTGKGSMVTISLFGTGIWTNAFNVMCTQPQFGMEYPPPEQLTDPFNGWHICADGKSVYCMTKEYRRDKLKYSEIYDMPELLTDPRFEDMDTIRESGVTAEYAKKVTDYEHYLVDDAEVIITAYGISARFVRSAIEALRAEGIKAGMVRPINVYPFPYEAYTKLDYNKIKGVLSVEMSIPELFAEDVRAAVGGRATVATYATSGGVILDTNEIIRKAREISKKEAV